MCELCEDTGEMLNVIWLGEPQYVPCPLCAEPEPDERDIGYWGA